MKRFFSSVADYLRQSRPYELRDETQFALLSRSQQGRQLDRGFRPPR